MRNDFKDEPIAVASLTIDDVTVESRNNFEPINRKKSQLSNGFIVFIVCLLFLIYSAGIGVLFWLFKQSTDDVRYQLSQTTNSTTQNTASNISRWQTLTQQLTDQQATTKTSLESLRNQNKQLATQLNKALTDQQTVIKQQTEQNSRLQKTEQQLQALSNYDGQIKQLTSDLATVSQSKAAIKALAADVKALQDKKLPQTIQSVQDDLLLLRSQLDASNNNDTKQQLLKLEKQLQSLQSQIDTLRQQLNSRSLY